MRIRDKYLGSTSIFLFSKFSSGSTFPDSGLNTVATDHLLPPKNYSVRQENSSVQRFRIRIRTELALIKIWDRNIYILHFLPNAIFKDASVGYRTVLYIPQVSSNAPVCFRTYLLCTLTIILLIFYDRKDGKIKKLEDKHFDFECDGCNRYKDLGPPLKPMRIQNNVKN